eukprot:TRINITY_DN4847_c0_g1_i1.p1 TRINITY_DN4847_c0_g1~~TRINITY_DN4847_c0_g1_i1.p1  ORF type:complete len:151 (-),score=32.19 TRINITY_DN4847_c0_g1_i1:121-507(-)
MLSAVRTRAVSCRPVATTAVRAFSQGKEESWFSKLFSFKSDRDIVEEDVAATGQRGEEVRGTFFNDQALMPPAGSGTREKPIEVPSRLDVRTVGYEDPETHAIYWFNLKAGKVHHVTPIDMYFKLTTY